MRTNPVAVGDQTLNPLEAQRIDSSLQQAAPRPGGAKAATPPMQMPVGPDGRPDMSRLVVGQTYQTAKGLMRYIGNGQFQAAYAVRRERRESGAVG